MKQTDPYPKPQQSAFLAFVALLAMFGILSSCAIWLRKFSVLQISLVLSVTLLLVSLALWFILRYRLRAQQASYLAMYRLRIRENSLFLLAPNGSSTDGKGKPLAPETPQLAARRQQAPEKNQP
jgi:hypothetical protein